MINLDPRYKNYWIDQAREEQKEKEKAENKRKGAIGNVLDLLDQHIKVNLTPNVFNVPTHMPVKQYPVGKGRKSFKPYGVSTGKKKP